MNENEIFRLKGRIAISNLSREDKNMINSILDGVNKKDEEEKGYVYTVRVKLNNGKGCTCYFIFLKARQVPHLKN